MIQIYIFFLWGYFKEHSSRIIYSLLGISFGIALFFATQVNSWRAEKSIIDAEAGYPDQNYIGHFQSNEKGSYGDETFLRELYFGLPKSIRFDPILVEDSFFEKENTNLIRFPVIGKDLTYSLGETKVPKDTSSKFQKNYIVSEPLYKELFEKSDLAPILVCNHTLELRSEDIIIWDTDGRFIATDVQILQQLCGHIGKFQKIALIKEPDTSLDSGQLNAIIAKGKELNWKWESIEFIRERSGKALGSLKVNLTIVSLISVLISFFMVANTFSGIYLARKKEFGILLSIGNSRIQNLFLFLSQGILLGILGSALGILIGQIFLELDFISAKDMITEKFQTISYHRVPLYIYLISFGIGIMGATVSCLFSSLKSYSVKPIDLIREKESTLDSFSIPAIVRIAATLGILLCVLSSFIGFLPSPKSLLPGLTGVGSVILGFIFLFPIVLIVMINWVMLAMERIHFFPSLRIAWEEIKLEPLPNTLTSATILLASSLVITLSTLTDSYEQTLIRWIEEDNQFDYSIINASKLSAGLPGVPSSLLSKFQAESACKKVEPFLIRSKFPIGDNYYTLHVYPFPASDMEILVSSNFCYLEKKCKGDNLEIQTEKMGKIQFHIKGEREHFFSERGTIMMNMENYQKYFFYSDLNSLRISFHDKISSEDRKMILDRNLRSESQDLKILNRDSLKALYLEGMRSVFSILDSLKISSIIISFLALLTSLVYNVAEKSKLFATLKAIGLDRYQLFKIIFFQSSFFIILGMIMGILNSLIVSPLVIFGVNKNAFGWALDFNYPFMMLFYFFLSIPLLSLLVSIYPYLSAKKNSIRESLNYE